MEYKPFYGPHKNIVELADMILADDSKLNDISDATNLYYSMKLISEIDRLYRCMYFYGGSSIIAFEIKDHILKLQKALGKLNESKSLSCYFSDLSDNTDHPYVKLLTECKNKGMPLYQATKVVSNMVSIPEYQLRKFIEDEKIDYPDIDISSGDFNEGATVGSSDTSDADVISKLLSRTLESSMNNKISERITDDPASYFKVKKSSDYIADTNFNQSVAEVENRSFNFSFSNGGSDSHVNRNKQSTGLNNYIAGILSTREFSQDAIDKLRLNSKVVQFSYLLDKVFKNLTVDNKIEDFITAMKGSNADNLSSSLNNYIKKINIKEVLGNNFNQSI